MNFILSNHAVQCVRTHFKNGREVAEIVVSFDAQLDTIAPHVSALLSAEEAAQLETWLEERAQLQHTLKDKPLGATVLEALPGLLQEATEAVQRLETLDSSLHNEIEQSLQRLQAMLNDTLQAKPVSDSSEFDSLQHEDVLKEQLTSIKSKV